MNGIIDPKRNSWIPESEGSGFGLDHLPLGIFTFEGSQKSICTRIGNTIIDLLILEMEGLLPESSDEDFSMQSDNLNDYMALGKDYHHKIREAIADAFEVGSDFEEAIKEYPLPSVNEVQMHLAVDIKDYTDFYSSREHATNVGTMFRDPENALLPNWLHLPVGYHGRASSIVVSGTPLFRPSGQTKPEDAPPVFGPCRLLDFELEMAFIIGKSTDLGSQVATDEAEDHIFGVALFNDWSARDIQKWEYIPLGPFLAKNFGSSLSAWISPLEAIQPFAIPGPVQEDPPILDYLKYQGKHNFDIDLEVYLQPEGGEETRICQSNYKYMYWNMAQQLAHHTVNGCNINTGDLYASGTISGTETGSFGSMLELSWKGTKPIKLADGTERKFIQDGDTIIMRGFAGKGDHKITLGEVSGKILPANYVKV